MSKATRGQRAFRFVLIFLPLCFAGGTRAQDVQQVVLIDFLGQDHNIRRETSVQFLGRGPRGQLRFRVHRELITKAKQQYTKGPPKYISPIRVGSVSIYPSSYGRVTFDDVPAGPVPKRVITIDEEAFLCIEGQMVDELLGRLTDLDRSLPARPVTNARLGMDANDVQEWEISDADIRSEDRRSFTSLVGGGRVIAGNVVDSVDPGGPAARAGLQIGDLIVRLNRVRTMTERKPEIVADYLPVGRPVTCTIIRRVQGKLEAINVAITPAGP